jgi:hypothetical protein
VNFNYDLVKARRVNYFLGGLEQTATAQLSDIVQNYRLKFRDSSWWIVTNGHWYGPYVELEAAQRLAIDTAAVGQQELRLPTKVIVHHRDGREETLN